MLTWGKGGKKYKERIMLTYFMDDPSTNPTSQPPFHPQFGINHNEKLPLDATSDENCLAWNLTAASL